MIISASRRTDIPVRYSEWFYQRLREKYVFVRHPRNRQQISRIDLSPEVVDGIVFWTKNPIPMLSRLVELEKYPYYFQFTLTAYGKDVEPNIPSKNKELIPAFRQLSKTIGREKVVWRYDPIFFNDRYTMEYHCKYFSVLAAKLGGYTEKCTVSFLDLYDHTMQNIRQLNIRQDTEKQRIELMQRFSETAHRYGFYIDACCESAQFAKLGIPHAHCIDRERFERIGHYKLDIEKDKNQRPACGCIASIDIGAYDTCPNGCLYCYANSSKSAAMRNTGIHHPSAPILIGEIEPNDRIKERNIQTCVDGQLSLFDFM